MSELRAEVERVFREEGGRIVASLIRRCGSFDLAEDALQEAFTAALAHWQADGVPGNAAAWITTAARRRLIDAARRRRTRSGSEAALSYEIRRAAGSALEREDAEPGADAYPDDRLRLIFTCCHPALHREAQVAVALNHAVAIAMSRGLADGLQLVDRLGAWRTLDGYPLYHAARADLLRRLGRPAEARAAYERALALTTNRVEQAYLRRRAEALG